MLDTIEFFCFLASENGKIFLQNETVMTEILYFQVFLKFGFLQFFRQTVHSS